VKQTEIDQLKKMYESAHYECFICGEHSTQRAHAVGDRKINRQLFGDDIIDSPLNWFPVCNLTCNALVDLGQGYILNDVVANIIRGDDDYEDKRGMIEDLILENIARKQGKVD